MIKWDCRQIVITSRKSGLAFRYQKNCSCYLKSIGRSFAASRDIEQADEWFSGVAYSENQKFSNISPKLTTQNIGLHFMKALASY
jgi:hypothetical protein